MGIFRRRDPNQGWTMYAPMTDGNTWQPSRLRSPASLPGNTVLRQRDGKITKLQTQERSKAGDRYLQVDTRRRLIQMHPQQIPTADAVNVTITLVLSARTIDPVAFVSDSQSPDQEIYLAAQIALRELVASLALEEFVGARVDLNAVLEAAQTAATRVGVEVTSAELKDVSLPKEYSSALQESFVSKVKSETELESARNEVKTTRARLASAKVLEQNPVLAKIRMIEARPLGSTIEVRGDQSSIQES